MAKPHPIGLSRKKPEEDGVEQLSFRMPASKKRQFAALLAEQGLEIKQVLIEFIDQYIKYRGNIGVVSLEDYEHVVPGMGNSGADEEKPSKGK